MTMRACLQAWLVAAALLVLATTACRAQKLAGYKSAAEAAAAALQLSKLSTPQRKAAFQQWARQMGRSPADTMDMRRWWAWNANLDAMIAANSRPGPFWRGLGEFGDFNFTELQAKYLRPLNPSSVRLRTVSAGLPLSGQRRLLQAPPAEWDWRGSSAVGPVRPLRKDCVAAWAAAALAAVEAKATINRTLPALPDLSDAQLLDCATTARGYRSAGCAGGYPEEAFAYITSAFAATEGAYSAARGPGCKTAASSAVGGVTLSPAPGFRRLSATPAAVMAALRFEGPVVTYMRADAAFAAYDGGVFLASACKPTTPINHVLVLVGYSQAKGVLIARNSWGSKWGEGGYVRLELAALGPCLSGPIVPLATSRFPRAPPPSPRPPPPRELPPVSGFDGRFAAAKEAAGQLASLSAAEKRRLFQRSWGGDERRFRAWEANLDKLIAFNIRPDITWLRQMNEFSDRNYTELEAAFLMRGLNPTRVPSRLARAATTGRPLPDAWDWRSTPGNSSRLVLGAQRQEECGSCYAIQSRATKDGTAIAADLSEQQMIDCIGPASNSSYLSQGCRGGYLEEVFTYVSRMYAVREAAYNYTGAAGPCRAATASKVGAVTLESAPGYEVIPGDVASVKQALVERGPLAAYMHVSEELLAYDSGIYTPGNCRDDVVNHAVLLIGYGRYAGQDYYIIMNSWGETWGEKGFARIAVGADNGKGPCGLLKFGVLAPLRSSAFPRSPPPRPPPLPPPPPPPPPPATKGLRLRGYTGLRLADFPDYATLELKVDWVLPTVDCPYPNLGICSAGLPGDFFALQLTGSLVVTIPGTYTLYLSSDDGSRLFLDDTLLMDNGGIHGIQTYAADVSLDAGWHPLRIDYFEWFDGASLLLEWEGPATGGRRIVPDDNLTPFEQAPPPPPAPSPPPPSPSPPPPSPPPPPTGGLRLRGYTGLQSPDFPDYSALALVVDRLLPAVDCPYPNLGNCSAGLPEDYYALQLTGSVLLDTPGTYNLYLTSDDGSRLTLAFTTVDNGGIHGLETEILTVTTVAPGWLPLQLDYFEWDGGAALTLEWEGPNTGGRSIIPSSHLSPAGGAD